MYYPNIKINKGKVMIGRIVAMLIKLGGRGFKVSETSENYEIE